MELTANMPLTLRLPEDQRGTEYVCKYVGPNRWGLCLTVPQVLNETVQLPPSTKVLVQGVLRGKLISFPSHVLGYEAAYPYNMVIAVPREISEEDRREWYRIPARIGASYSLPGLPGQDESTHTVDISVGGVAVVTKAVLNRGTLLNLHLELTEPLSVAARVAWGAYRGWQPQAGIEFCNLTRAAENTICQYVFALQRQRGGVR